MIPNRNEAPASVMAVTIACIGLTAMPACDECQTKSSTLKYRKQQFQRELIVELCMPGTYYMECIWHRQEICHLRMPMAVVYCTEPPIRPGETHREAVLDCVLHAHFGYATDLDQDELREECVDPTRWEHIPPISVGTLKTIRETWYELKAARETSLDPDDSGDEPGDEPGPARSPDGSV